VTTLQYNIVVK